MLKQGGFRETTWAGLHVGDIIKIEKDQQVPADLLLLYSAEEKGNCFIETKNLDGETNLKEKKANSKLQQVYADGKFESMYSQNLSFSFERPNPYLYTFTGKITLPDGSMLPLDNNNFILRGCSLRNTNFIYGVVTYNGHESKIMLNSVKAQPKVSLLERMMNKQIFKIVIIQISICLFFAVFSVVYQEVYKSELKYMEFDKDNSLSNEWYISWPIYLGKWILILNNFIPISLMVSHEMVKYIQAMVITRDKKMESNLYGHIAAVVQSSSLTEELGQIDYIFSDKTGTLTCNIMDFKKLYSGGEVYGEDFDSGLKKKEYKDLPNVAIREAKLFDTLENKENPHHANLDKTLWFLALCHTALVEGSYPDKFSYCVSYLLNLDQLS